VAHVLEEGGSWCGGLLWLDEGGRVTGRAGVRAAGDRRVPSIVGSCVGECWGVLGWGRGGAIGRGMVGFRWGSNGAGWLLRTLRRG